MSDEPDSKEPVSDKRSVREYETNFLKEKQDAVPRPPRSLCGLALSGGGLRSATFNLGLLQGLHQLKLLGMFDYLATVSGGGYIGGFWTAWRHHAKEEKDPLFPSAGGRSRGTHLEAVRHLREFSNFLRPRMGLLSPDTGRMMTAALSAVIPSLLAALSLIVLALLFWFGLAWLLLVGWQSEQPLPFARLALSGAVMFLVTCALLGFLEWRLLVQDERVKKARSQSTCAKTTDTPAPARWSFPYFLGDSLLTALFVLGVWAWLLYAYHEDAWVGQGVLLNVPTLPESGLKLKERFYVFSPALAWVAAAGVLVLRRWLLSRWMMQPQSQKENAVDRIISRLLILAALWSAISAFWLTGQIMYDDMQGKSGPALAQTGFILALTALFTKVQRFFGSQVSKPVSPTWKSKAKELLPQLLAYAIIVLLVLGMVALLQPATRAEDWRWISVPLLVAGAITLFTLLFFDPNNVGLHAFYRSRIARTFIGAAHGKAPGETELHAEDDLPLDELRYKSGPFHIICCTANDLAPEDPMLNLYRGATSAVLSCKGFSVGGEGEGWEALKGRGVPVPSLAAAMTASGAALNSHMGSMSMRMGPAVTFLMTAFNLRLGLWWPHPIRERVPGKKSPWVGLPFYKELFGRSRSQSQHVLLSDGGHFENLALYELVRRHCQFILVADCGMDTEREFDDFANAVRRIREDFKVEIRIDLSALRPGPDGLSRQALVAGDIEYPDGNTGVLLFIKPTLLGNEPADITQYKARNTDFPHETTGDQFYDEAQWEAYRRLGEHAALTAFRSMLKVMEQPRAAHIFARARYDWQPVPAGYEERYSHFAAQASSLDTLLQTASGQKLFRQVFNEITEMGGNASPSGGRQESEGDGASEPPEPSAQELADAFHLLRRVLLFMEEVFFSENLAVHYNHSVYSGVMNYFAHWAYAPLFRTWWPLLKTQYSPRFTSFLEEHFSLPGMERKDIGMLSGITGFAMRCWLEQKGRRPLEDLESLVSYQLNMPHGRKPRYYIQAAQLIARTRGADGGPLLYGKNEQLVVWRGDDFYVPPGLWGAGIGNDFLRLLHSDRRLLDFIEGARDDSILAVRLLVDQDASAARRKGWADDAQLYRSHDFTEPEPELREVLDLLNGELDENPALDWPGMKSNQWRRYWLVRRFIPTEPTAEHPERVSDSSAFPDSEQPMHH